MPRQVVLAQGSDAGARVVTYIAMQRADRPTPNRATLPTDTLRSAFATQAEPCQLDEGARCLARCLAVDTLAVHEQWPEVLEAFEELGASLIYGSSAACCSM